MAQENLSTKFDESDLPTILAALHTARESKCPATVRVEFGKNGGVIAVMSEIRRQFK